MADVDLSSGNHKGGGVKKAKKLSTRVDLTPMVDLGFLLLTFFVFSSTLSQPSSMKMNLPDESNTSAADKNQAKADGVLSLVLGKNNNLYYYEGQIAADGSNVKKTDYAHLREVVVNKKNATNPDDFVVIIMAGNQGTYENVVNVLDEMTIDDVQAYNLQTISPEAKAYLDAHDK